MEKELDTLCKFEDTSRDLTVDSIKVSPSDCSKKRKKQLFYCVMTLSVIAFSLTVAASSLLADAFDKSISEQKGVLYEMFSSDGASRIFEALLQYSFADGLYTDSKSETSSDKSPNTEAILGSTTEGNSTSSSELQTQKPTDNSPTDGIYDYDFGAIPEGMSGIVPMDLSLPQYGLSYINSSSIKSVNSDNFLKYSFSIKEDAVYPSDQPLVLIVHTHGTESYSESGALWYDSTKEIARSDDIDRNVVALGRQMARILNENGISAIHCETMHDLASYTSAYASSAQTIKAYLQKYPSIQFVIDIHRDAIQTGNGELVRPVTASKDGASAQIMCVVGTGENGTACPKWESNLAFAQKLRKTLNDKYCENVCRPTCLRDSSYNQQYAAVSLLLEIGAAGNSLEEAQHAAKMTALAICDIINGKAS